MEPEAESQEDEALDLLLRRMVKRVNSNENGLNFLTQQFLKQNSVVTETLHYLSDQLNEQ